MPLMLALLSQNGERYLLVVLSGNGGKWNCKGFPFLSLLVSHFSQPGIQFGYKKSSFLLEPVIAFNLLRAVPLPESIQTCLLLLAKTNLQVLFILSTPWALLFNSWASQTLKINGNLNSHRVMFCVKNRSSDKVCHQQPLYPSEPSNSGCCHVRK